MQYLKHNSLIIETPEGCSFSLQLAGPVIRFFAWCVDLLCIVALTMATSKLLMVLSLISPDIGMAIKILVMFVIWIGYGILLEWFWNGRTLGKKVFRLRVMDENGLRLTFSQVVIRNIMRFADMLPLLYLVGGICCLITPRAQRIGDVVAGTIVTYTPRILRPDISKVTGGKFNSFTSYPHLNARLRQRVSPAEARIALQAVMRRDSLDAAARLELFSDLAGHFQSIVQFPQEVTDGLSDERYVRNVVDVLYRSQSGSSARQSLLA